MYLGLKKRGIIGWLKHKRRQFILLRVQISYWRSWNSLHFSPFQEHRLYKRETFLPSTSTLSNFSTCNLANSIFILPVVSIYLFSVLRFQKKWIYLIDYSQCLIFSAYIHQSLHFRKVVRCLENSLLRACQVEEMNEWKLLCQEVSPLRLGMCN